MAESWRKKQVDIVHWLQGLRPPSPEPLKESDRELTSSSDITTTNQAPSSPPVTTTRPISHPHRNLADNMVLLQSPAHPNPSPSPVNEPVAVANIQPSLSSVPPQHPLPSIPVPEQTSIQSVQKLPDWKSPLQRKRKNHSPLPLAMLEPKLPIFVTTEDDPITSMENLSQQTVNKMVNRPPSRPMRTFSRASTSPILSDSSQSPVASRRASPSPVEVRLKLHNLTVGSDLLKYRRKSMSQDDISHLVERERRASRERRLSKERHCSDSELTQTEPGVILSERDSLSSTEACGHCSDFSDTSSTERDGGPIYMYTDTNSPPGHREGVANESTAAMKRRMFGRGVLSAGSVDVLTTRLRERKMGIGAQTQDEEDVSLTLPTHLLSPTSPTQSHHSRFSRSPSPTQPASPLHTPIFPPSIPSESSTPVPKPQWHSQESESRFSKSKLQQFNMSQQFSFDTTNDDDFCTPSRQPKFLKNNISVLSKVGAISHSRSHSDVSAIPSLAYSNARYISNVQGKSPTTRSPPKIRDKNMRQYRSQLELSTVCTSPEGEGGKPLTMFEQLGRTRRQQAGRKANQLLRQDSGIGTLSTVSQKF